ncbi:hypothetical protein [Lentzea albida]|uniref:Cytochrome C biogenesis protein transmembrane region n=1 Tax=Lentzea albida TaxID=65499 RepID=A0A1H9WI06_9PSEU|nr:hypothetical protein [Lentzea albida]SES33093.1 hypothetical protein SAMN04488000_12286 [Lentzea albida]
MVQTLPVALVAGMVATVDPCGFAVLPAYLALVVIGASEQSRARLLHGASKPFSGWAYVHRCVSICGEAVMPSSSPAAAARIGPASAGASRCSEASSRVEWATRTGAASPRRSPSSHGGEQRVVVDERAA